jgi:hypothetical protein
MTEVDTSSYPKATLPVSPLDMAGKLGALQQQKLSIDQAKLDQANQGFTYLTRAMASIGPNPGPDWKQKYLEVGANAVKMGLVPEQQLQVWADRVNQAPDSTSFYQQTINAVQQHQQILQNYVGQNDTQDNGAITRQGVRKPAIYGGGFDASGGTQSFNQPPPTQPNVDTNRTLPNGQPNPNYGQPGIRGPAGPSGVYPAGGNSLPVAGPAGAAPAPALRPRGLPVERPPGAAVSGPTGATIKRGTEFNDRFAGEPSLATGLAPGVAGAIETVGKQSGQDYASDLTRAKNFQSDIYPMQKVLDIVKEEGPKAFGPGTEGLNAVKSALVTWLPNVDQKTIEGVSNYEQARKYLVQAARTAGNTGTNDQLAAAFEANPNVKMSGATIDTIVKSNLALRKMQHAQTLLFGQQNLPASEYSQWVAKNQNVLDPRAFGWDMMEAPAKAKLMTEFAKKDKGSGEWIAKDKAHEREFKKFEQSISFANDAGLIEPPGRKQ